MRWKLAAGVVVVILLAGLGLWWRSRTPAVSSAPSPSAGTPAAAPAASGAAPGARPLQQQVADDIVENGLTPDRAKLLFSLVVGPLPGVDIPAGAVRDPSDFDGTPAVVYLAKVWASLSAEQRRAAAMLIDATAAKSSAGAGTGGVTIIPAAYAPTDDVPAFDYDDLLKEANGALRDALSTNGNTMAPIHYVYEVNYGAPEGTEFAHTISWWQLTENIPLFNEWKAFPDHSCHIRIHNQKFVPLLKNDARSVLTHEMFHCYEQRLASTTDNYLSVRTWITEGEATWVMAAAVPSATIYQKDWDAYITTPQKTYSKRRQDGIGVFGHLGDLTSDAAVWSKLLPVFSEAIDPSMDDHSEDALKLLIDGVDKDYFTSWGASYFLSGKQPWSMNSPGSVPTTQAPIKDVVVAPDQLINLGGLDQYLAAPIRITGNADIVGIALLAGYGRLHDKDSKLDTVLTTSGKLALCLKPGGCRCPDGSPGASLVTKEAAAPVSIGLEAGDSMGQMDVAGASLDDFCKEPDKKPGSPLDPGGGGGGGGSGGPGEQQPPKSDGGKTWGDTHITTFDGLKYDFQVVGEYTLVRSTKDDFAVQVRQAPVLKSRTVTVNQAVAAKIDGRRVTVTLENGVAVLRIDDRTITGEPPKLAHGSIVPASTMYGTTYLLNWADGTTVQVEQLGPRVLNVHVNPAAKRHGALTGLLGDDDGSPANDLVGPAGSHLGLQPSAEDLNRKFADAWRLTQAASLFDYQPGQSTASFVDRTFPDSHVDPMHVENRAEAEQRCRAAGVTDTRLLDDCILDYAVTNDWLFASSYSHAQQVLAAHAIVPRARTSGVLRTVLLSGTITDPTQRPTITFEAQAGDVVWLGQPDCTDQYMQLALRTPSGRGIGGGAVCSIGRRVLPETGTYSLTGFRDNNPLGAYSVPIRIVRPDKHQAVKYGDVIAGAIEARGIHDVFTFEAHAGDVVRIAGEGCDAGILVVGLIDPNGHDFLGPSCRAGTDTRLTETGTYQLVVNAADGGSGTYHFVLQGAPGKSPQ